MTFSISRSSIARSASAVISPRSRLARASFSTGGRSRLPTWSARNGGVVRCIKLLPTLFVLRALDCQARLTLLEHIAAVVGPAEIFCGIKRIKRAHDLAPVVAAERRHQFQKARRSGRKRCLDRFVLRAL